LICCCPSEKGSGVEPSVMENFYIWDALPWKWPLWYSNDESV
jgi:hypothetical protein